MGWIDINVISIRVCGQQLNLACAEFIFMLLIIARVDSKARLLIFEWIDPVAIIRLKSLWCGPQTTLVWRNGSFIIASLDGSKRSQFISKFLRSEEHTSELQSRPHLVCRLLLEKIKSSA